MSKKDLEDFGQLVAGKDDLKQQAEKEYVKLAEAQAKAQKDYCDAMVKLGKDNGFDFTADEVNEKFKAGLEEISDVDLSAVAGGISFSSPDLSFDKSLTSFSPRLPGFGSVAGT